MNLYNEGQRRFGENYVQEIVDKQATLPTDIEWHFIGHLQSNKVKYIAPFVSMIHSVDSFKLLTEINKQAAKNERVIRVLLQFHIAEEDTKFGFDTEGVKEMMDSFAATPLSNIEICGVMGMATFTDNKAQVRREFQVLKKIFDECEMLYNQPLVISQISFSNKTQVEDHLLMIGDAAGMITPLCGNGMSMAMHGSAIAFSFIYPSSICRRLTCF